MTSTLPVDALPSRYVRRCVRCREVRGLSSFAKERKAYTNVCRWCRDAEREAKRPMRVYEWRLTHLRRAREDLRRRVENITGKIRRLERRVGRIQPRGDR